MGSQASEEPGRSLNGSSFPEWSARSASAFKLIILDDDWDHLLYRTYSLKDSWAVLQKVDLAHSPLTVSGADIATYAWSSQEMTLTEEASKKLAAVFAGPAFPDSVSHRCFVVTLDGRRLYGGIFLEPWSAMGIGFPVVYVVANGSQFALLVRPYHASLVEYRSFSPSAKSEIEIPEIRAFFAQQGKLV